MESELTMISSDSSKTERSESFDEINNKDDRPLLKPDTIRSEEEDASDVDKRKSEEEKKRSIDELEKKYAAFVRKDVYGTLGCGELGVGEKVKLGLAMVTLVPVRLVIGMTILVVYYLICRVMTLFKAPNREEENEQEDYAHMGGVRRVVVFQCGRFLSRVMLFVLGFYWIKVTVRCHDESEGNVLSEEQERPGAIISNHVSYIDILYHMSTSFPSFVAKRSVAKLPLVGLISKCLGCVFVQRESKSPDFKGVSGVVTERVREAHQNKDAPMMMLFPEGTTTNGNYLLSFKTGAFLSKAPVLPVILRYPYQRLSPAWDSISGARHMLLLLCQFVNFMEVTRLPVYYPSAKEKDNPKLYADNVRQLMAREGNLIMSDIGLAEKRIYHAALNVNYSLDMPLNSDVFRVPPGYNAPQQVHITQGDHDGRGVIISWVTPNLPGSNTVFYWTEHSKSKRHSEGTVLTYKYSHYTSGYIHHCTITNLEFNTTYYYEVGAGYSSRTFSFTTPPSPGLDVPYTFGLIGDLGQTFDSNRTLDHYQKNPANGQTLLFVGDLSYADVYPFHDNVRWDTWGRFTERSVAYQAWIWTAGNHELDFAPDLGEHKPFVPYTSRYHVPYEASGSTSPLWYSIKRASAYIIVLSSYSAYGKYTQYKWLETELQKVNRSQTPWLVVIMHCPIYNSYVHHYMEGETMRVMYEPWFVEHKVDVVFAGHVHSYERSERISNIAYNITNTLCDPIKDESAPIYITIGDGGNLEGLAMEMTEPQPTYSAFREASFGHGIFDIKNRSHAFLSWHRNEDGYAVIADSTWLLNRYWKTSKVLHIAAI